MTVYTVKQTGLTRAGPQKCASVNVVLVLCMQLSLVSYISFKALYLLRYK